VEIKKNALASTAIFWFRRDLRLHDNAGLYHALKANKQVLPVFIFDAEILNKLEDKNDARVTFIHDQTSQIHKDLHVYGSTLLVKYGKPEKVFQELLQEYEINAVYTNHDYEPYALKRDAGIEKLLSGKNIDFYTFKDQVIFEKEEVAGDAAKPYRVYTPYKNKWLQKLNNFYLSAYPVEKYVCNFIKIKSIALPALREFGFTRSAISVPGKTIREKQIRTYEKTRDYPYENSTSGLSIHLRFGTLSIRHVAARANELNQAWLSELIWREFFMQLLFHFPEVVDHPFNSRFKNMTWRYNEKDFHTWCEGKTGYPLVDAGMRELNATGYMHNRVRMVTASFLTKHLLIDWKWGEAYFARKLLDYDLASNNGNWQWSAGTGADAQPFFRIFNPQLQQEKFDLEFAYIKQWVPEFGTSDYPQPMVEHKAAVARAKEAFGLLRSGAAPE
jgi:deoxyribodipyrimidine photo-lyase